MHTSSQEGGIANKIVKKIDKRKYLLGHFCAETQPI